ncbi:MAG: CBS domain-containing protein [Aliidongia sp.]
MTHDVQTCSLQDTVSNLMEIMTRGRFRHLPVVENDKLIGIISIGDVVKAARRRSAVRGRGVDELYNVLIFSGSGAGVPGRLAGVSRQSPIAR